MIRPLIKYVKKNNNNLYEGNKLLKHLIGRYFHHKELQE